MSVPGRAARRRGGDRGCAGGRTFFGGGAAFFAFFFGFGFGAGFGGGGSAARRDCGSSPPSDDGFLRLGSEGLTSSGRLSGAKGCGRASAGGALAEGPGPGAAAGPCAPRAIWASTGPNFFTRLPGEKPSVSSASFAPSGAMSPTQGHLGTLKKWAKWP